MSNSRPKLGNEKDREAIILKFSTLIDKASAVCNEYDANPTAPVRADKLYEVWVGALNLLSRITGTTGVYFQELKSKTPLNCFVIKGVLQAAQTDYQEGWVGDHKMLLSAEVFDDLLVQGEVLLDNGYKDAAAVVIRAVLENGLRRLCEANKIEIAIRETIQQFNEKLYKAKVYSALQHKEIIAKTEVGNSAAHGKFDQYDKRHVMEFLDFVRCFLAEYLR